ATLTRRRAELLAALPSARGAAETANGAAEAPDPGDLGLSLGRRNAQILDALLTDLFQGLRTGAIAVDAVRAVPPGAWDTVALAGVGSYGRGAVALKSDLDVRILARNVDKAAAVADALLYPLWDMGVSIGHQV